MRRIIIAMLMMLSISAFAQESLKVRMERIENDFGVSFVYASTLPVDSMPAARAEYGNELLSVLENTFAGTGIKYEIRKRNVILTQLSIPKKFSKKLPLAEVHRMHILLFRSS